MNNALCGACLCGFGPHSHTMIIFVVTIILSLLVYESKDDDRALHYRV